MTPEELSTEEAKAERFLKRGEFLRALAVFRGIVAAHPERTDLAQKVQQISESLHPSELAHAMAPQEPADHGPAATPEEEGERLFAQGDYAGAAAAYRRALEKKPNSELIKERLVELFHLVQVQYGKAQSRSAPTAPSPAAPSPTAPSPASLTPEQKLKALLDRISSRRRS